METTEEQQEVDIDNLQQQVHRIPSRGRPAWELPLPYTPEWTEECPGCEGKTSQHTAACLRNKRFLKGELSERDQKFLLDLSLQSAGKAEDAHTHKSLDEPMQKMPCFPEFGSFVAWC
eukprot:2766243-Amphidinium_carterae.2